jgi:hypothetical protein
MAASIADAATVTGIECFVDVDPGEGNGIPLVSTDGTFDEEREEAEVTIDLSSLNLKRGYHIIYCRAKNDSDEWSMARPLVNDLRVINPNLTITGEKHIVAAECFFDTDPGMGQGIPCQCADGACDEPEEEIQCNNVDVSALPNGMHKLYLRTQDSEGLWGVTRRYTVQTYEPTILIAGEYFIDDDPGAGNGIPILFPKDFFWDEAEEEVELSIDASGYAIGNHLMFVRMKDSYERWGLPDCEPFGEDPCGCDLNDDGSCNFFDWLVFIEDWGDCAQVGCSCDLNQDSSCNFFDWLLFIPDWGRTDCPVCP